MIRVIPKRRTDAIARRIAAAQSGGTASFPNRIARKVLPQMSAHATKVTATRMLTTLERPTGPRCEQRPNCCQRRAVSAGHLVRTPYISVTTLFGKRSEHASKGAKTDGHSAR